MSASDSQLESDAEDGLSDALATGVKRYRIRDREVERHDPVAQLDALLKLRGLQSSRRGFNLGKVDKPS